MKKESFLILFLLFFLQLPSLQADAALNESRAKIEAQYGTPDLVENHQKQFAPWQELSDTTALAAAYGYLNAVGESVSSRWLTYDERNCVTKELVLFKQALSVRHFAPTFGKEYDVAAKTSEVFVEQTLRGEQLTAILVQPDGARVQLRFLPQGYETKPNMHTRLIGFEASRISEDELQRKLSQRIWRKTDNFFQEKLYFSETLKKRKRTDMIVIHHTAIEGMSVADIQQLHLSNGWAGIGYHKVILPDGMVQDGRPLEMVGAHALGANLHSVGIVVVGDFEQRRPSETQLISLLQITRQMMHRYKITPENVRPHREATAGTSCPGAQFPWTEFRTRLNAMP
ncbi:peptidoglycan recognition family protein [Azotosporobacter soli]|uniref:peptidoglycan recognition protein family protein n=1 Tax=Azotosporobacter soli TaxID=3055040 RepID=UPI0031FF45BA